MADLGEGISMRTMRNIYTNKSNEETSYNFLTLGVTDLPDCEYNSTPINNGTQDLPLHLKVIPYVVVCCYSVICLVGLVGNSLVIYVVLRFAKMKTVTNMYILNLALSDILFLVTLPITIITTLLREWVFGLAICKLHLVLFSLNLFGGVFNLCVMSADRYLAVCHPIRSMKYRTSLISLFSCFCIWCFSFVVVMPVIMYTRLRNMNTKDTSTESCVIDWPSDEVIPANIAFIWYCFILGFAIPVSLISVFYILVIIRLQHVGPAKKSKEKRKSHRRVTRLVLSVITVYVVCWLPYWVFQIRLVFMGTNARPSALMKILFNFFTVLSYTNSMLNPFLYAFLSDNFRKSFGKAFKCNVQTEISRSTVVNENSVFPRTSQTCTRNGSTQYHFEETTEMSVRDSSAFGIPPLTTKAIQDEQGFLKPPTQL